MLVAAVVSFVTQLLQMAWIWAILVPLELFWPRSHQIGWLTRLRGVALMSLYLAASAVIAATTVAAEKALGLHPLFAAYIHPEGPLGHFALLVAGTALSVLLFDFLYYWQHRAQHRWFWPVHAVHHSIRDLGAANSYGHWAEDVIRVPLLTVPLMLLTPLGMETWPWAMSLVTLQSYYVHTATRLHLGPFWRIIYDPRFHRIHHSMEQRHFDRNFGVLTPLWDWMFGTLYVPAEDEWPQTGLADQGDIDGVLDFLWRPFRVARRA